MINTVREVLERNISTIAKLEGYFILEIYSSEKHAFIEEIKRILDILRNRDKRIQILMQIMEERFKKVWKLPWDLVKIIHSFTWKRDDLTDISSRVECSPHANCIVISTGQSKNRRWMKKNWRKGQNCLSTWIFAMEKSWIWAISHL